MGLSALFLASCVAGFAVGIPLPDAWGYLVFFVLFLYGSSRLFKATIAVFRDWWSPPPNGTQEDSAGKVEAAKGDEDKGKRDQRQID